MLLAVECAADGAAKLTARCSGSVEFPQPISIACVVEDGKFNALKCASSDGQPATHSKVPRADDDAPSIAPSTTRLAPRTLLALAAPGGVERGARGRPRCLGLLACDSRRAPSVASGSPPPLRVTLLQVRVIFRLNLLLEVPTTSQRTYSPSPALIAEMSPPRILSQ